MNPIEIESLSKTYRGRRGKVVVALKDLNLSVAAGEVFGFLGPNGAGKSTTIKTLVGQIRPTNGSASLFGQPTGAAGARIQVGYLPENPTFYDFLTAQEYLTMIGRIFGMSTESIRFESERVLELMTLTEAARRPIRGYSKGMVQRLGIAQALLHNPDLLIFDEPMSGLDPVGRALVKQIILELKQQGKTIFFSTHVIADVEEVCDRVGIIAAGKMQTVLNVADVLKSGIEGYSVKVSGCSSDLFPDYKISKQEDGWWSTTVPRAQYRGFMEQLFANDGQIEFIEPQRRSLEALFLDIIDQVS
ncbi:MAG: ABC transporter ATP-binding protein [Desulfobulbaceae bacterium]|nr:ABC transporter ATP-binding protein [Desulfobulbaceae bacterium]